MRRIFILIFTLVAFACTKATLPKPSAFLSLTYPKKSYKKLPLKKPYAFEVLESTILIDQANHWLKIKYPSLKASIDITYRPIENNIEELLTDAEKLVFKQTLKAAQIIPKDFINSEKRVFGSVYEITGNAASQIQFHVTDSTNNFLKASLYFYITPNYDSILPAVEYIKKDILNLIETLEWIE